MWINSTKIHFHLNLKSNFIINKVWFIINKEGNVIRRWKHWDIKMITSHCDTSYLILCSSYAAESNQFQYVKWFRRFKSQLQSSRTGLCLVCWRFQFAWVLDPMPKLILLNVALENKYQFCVPLLRELRCKFHKIDRDWQPKSYIWFTNTCNTLQAVYKHDARCVYFPNIRQKIFYPIYLQVLCAMFRFNVISFKEKWYKIFIIHFEE